MGDFQTPGRGKKKSSGFFHAQKIKDFLFLRKSKNSVTCLNFLNAFLSARNLLSALTQKISLALIAPIPPAKAGEIASIFLRSFSRQLFLSPIPLLKKMKG